jgi:hypothetical protein
MKEKIIAAFILLIASAQVIQAQKDSDIYVKTIKAGIFEKHVSVLTSDSCAGRTIGSEGIKIAGRYIIGQWENGSILKPYLNTSWTQSFPLITYSNKTTQIKVNGLDLRDLKDYMYTGPYDGLNAILPVVFAGNGDEEDFENLDVKGKAVFSLNSNLRAAMKNAGISDKHGAVLTIVANPESTNQFESLSGQYANNSKEKKYRSPDDTLIYSFLKKYKSERFITVSSETVKKLTSFNIHHWKNKYVLKNDSIGTLNISIGLQHADTVMANNIIGFIPGTNTHESVIIGAHYDHLGIIDDKIYRGADDNASGVAAMLVLSGAFEDALRDGYKPEMNIVFIAFSAEEEGLYGSGYFVKHLVNKDEIKLMVNLDMIGRADSDHSNDNGYFYFIGRNLADSLYTQNRLLCKKYNLTPDYTSNIDASDHKSFFEIGIPSIFYFDGINQDLHKPTDTPDKLNYNRMEKMTKMIFETIWLDAGMKKNSTGTVEEN